MADNSDVSAKTARRRGPGRPFQKGASGNPGGRPKQRALTDALSEIADPEELARVLYDMAVKDRNLAALQYLWNRLEGSPTQRHEVDIDAVRSEARRLARAAGVDEEQAVREAEAILRGEPYRVGDNGDT